MSGRNAQYDTPYLELPPQHFVDTLSVNVNNEKMSDEQFRIFVRNTLPLYIKKDEDSS
jgi:hypothetical protein